MTFRGILDYASKHGPWFCKFMEGRIGEQEFGVGGKGEIDGVLEFKEAEQVCGDAGCGWLHVRSLRQDFRARATQLAA